MSVYVEKQLMRLFRVQFLLFLVALTLQVLAPMAGNLAHAKAFRESGVSTIICEAADGSRHSGKTSQNHHAANKHCLLCQSFCDSIGFTPVGGQAGLVATNAWVLGAIPAQLDTSPASQEIERYRARAPPTLFPRLG